MKRNNTFRTGTLNTFISTTETDRLQETIDYFYQNSPKKKYLKKQLSKISENPINKNIKRHLNNLNIDNISNSLIINKEFGKRNKENVFEKRYSYFINNIVPYKTFKFRVRSAVNHKRSLTKPIIDIKKLINYNEFDYYKSYISDNQSSEKKQIKIKEICSILIERNKIREQHIQIQNNKFISFFSIERENEINEKCNKHKDSIINCCSTKIKKFLRNIKYEKKYEIKNFKKMKNEILINEKERRLLTVVTKFYYKKLKIEFQKERTNIVHLKYAYKLSSVNFPIILNPKNISIKLETNLRTDLFENFTKINNDLANKSETLTNSNTKKKTNSNIVYKKIFRKNSSTSNVIRLSLKALKFINNFAIKDAHKEKKTRVYIQFVNRIQQLIPQKKNKLKFFLKNSTFLNLKSKYDIQKKKTNVGIKDKYEKSFLTKEFFLRKKEVKIDRKFKRRLAIFNISESSLTFEMKKNKIYLKSESLINNKEHTIQKTIEIKTQIESAFKNELERLIYCIKDLNFYQFKNIYEQYSLSPNLMDKQGNTLLSIAVQANCFQISNYLLNSGANPNISNVKYILILFLD